MDTIPALKSLRPKCRHTGNNKGTEKDGRMRTITLFLMVLLYACEPKNKYNKHRIQDYFLRY